MQLRIIRVPCSAPGKVYSDANSTFVAGHKDAGCIALAVPSLPASLEMIESTKKKPDREGMRPGLSSCRRGMPAFTFQRGITVCGWLRSGRIRKPLASSMLGVSVCNTGATTPKHVKLPCVSRKSLERFRAKWAPVRVKKTRQNKRLEPGFDSIKAERFSAIGKRNQRICAIRKSSAGPSTPKSHGTPARALRTSVLPDKRNKRRA